ncbi:MAG: hypothetical protein V1918_11010 [Planctomycetota bacterium]
MKTKHKLLLAAGLALLLILVFSPRERDFSFARILPDEAYYYLEVRNPKALRVSEPAAWKEAFEGPTAGQSPLWECYQDVALFLGTANIQGVADVLAPAKRGAAALVDLKRDREEWVLALQTARAQKLLQAMKKELGLAWTPVEGEEGEVFRLDRGPNADALWALAFDDVLVLAESRERLRRTMEIRRGERPSLHRNPRFRASFAHVLPGTALWAYGDIQALLPNVLPPFEEVALSRRLQGIDHGWAALEVRKGRPGPLRMDLHMKDELAQGRLLPGGSKTWSIRGILIALALAPFVLAIGLLLLLILVTVLLAFYYYLDAYLTGRLYRKILPEPAAMSTALAASLGAPESSDGGEEPGVSPPSSNEP